MRWIAALCALPLVALSSQASLAQRFTTAPCHEDGGGWFLHQERACEVRSTVFPLNGDRFKATGYNGAIQVVGEDRQDVAMEARVVAFAPTRDEADALLHRIEITTGNDVHESGPSTSGRHGWAVSYKLRVPRRLLTSEFRTQNGPISVTDLNGSVLAASSNGGITLTHVMGDVRANSTNGGLTLDGLGGSVYAETTNGGVHVVLAGDRWHGNELFAKSTNGGITVEAPEHFAAHLVADTTNGGIHVDFPITAQGKIEHHVETDVNGGGPPVRLETTNGGISVSRS